MKFARFARQEPPLAGRALLRARVRSETAAGPAGGGAA